MRTRILAIVALTCGLSGVCLAQSSATPATTAAKATGGSSAPYNEGPVWTLTMIKTKTGLADEYIKQITGTVKPVYDEEKKQKVILDYKILNGEASDRHDFNILILVEYPNWAALDNLRDKMSTVNAKVMAAEEQRRDRTVKLLDDRELRSKQT